MARKNNEIVDTIGIGIRYEKNAHFRDSHEIVIYPLVQRHGYMFPVNPGLSLPELEYLELRGSFYVGDNKATFYLDRPQYKTPYNVDLSRAKTMLKVLTKIAKVFEKTQAAEFGDALVAFADAIGAEWYATPREKNIEFSSYSDVVWRFLPICDARDDYRQLIRDKAEEIKPTV